MIKIIFNPDKELINVKFNEREGHYLLLTNRRCKLLKKGLEKTKKFKVGSIDLECDNLEFIELNGKIANTKIKCKKLNDLSSDLVNYKQSLVKKMKEIFYNMIKEIIEINGKELRNYCKIISIIDFINSEQLHLKD